MIAMAALFGLALSGCGSRKAGRAKEAALETGSGKDIAKQQPLTSQLFAMTTVMDLAVYTDDQKTGQKALGQAEEEIHRLDSLLSTGDRSSEVSRLNRDGGGVMSEDTAYLTERSLQLYQMTGGAFDFTIYPLMDLWGFTKMPDPGSGTTDSETEVASEEVSQTEAAEDTAAACEAGVIVPPADASIRETLSKVGSDKVVLSGSSSGQTESTLEEKKMREITLPEGTRIDFGGIAKGYTSARIMDIYKANKVTGGLASLGGNVQVTGHKPDGSSWKVGIEDPADTSKIMGVLSLDHDAAVITSGGYERYLTDRDGKVYPHILDPDTGKPAETDLKSVTIVSRDGTLADGLSTALYVMGKEKAIAFWKEHSDLFEAILLAEDGKQYVTEGLRDSYQEKQYETEIVER